MMNEDSLKERTAKGLIWGGLSNGLMQLIGALFGMVLLRYLTPDDQGKVAMLYIFSALASALQESGFIAALCNRKEPTHEEYNAVFWFNLLVSATLYIILWFCAPLIADFYHDQDLISLARVLFLGFLFSGLGTVQRAYLFGHLMVRQNSICSLTAMLLSGIVGVTMAIKGFAYWAIVTQAVCFVFVTQVMAWFFSPWRPTVPRIQNSKVKSQNDSLPRATGERCSLFTLHSSFFTFLEPAWKMFGFSSKLMLTNIVNICNLHAFSVLLGRFFGEHTAGIYSTARRWDDMASNTINSMVSGVAQPTLAQVREDIGRYRQVFRKMMRFVCFVTFPAMFGLAIIAKDFIVLVGKEKWAECGIMLAILCIHGAVVPITTLYSNLTISRGKSGVNMFCTIAQCLAVWAGLLLLYPKGLMPMVIYFISLNIAWLGIWQWWAKRLVGLRWREALKDILPFLFFTLIVHGFTWWATNDISTLWIRMVCRIIMAGVLYAGIMWVSGAKIMRETVEYLAPSNSPIGGGKKSHKNNPDSQE
ncbi:MAG: lipopolysaccharide biosynthesis protein [Bacteroidaceae bacterium]|nr:lipopolysaccharide biosynthesis protein [Bacteroidaceae bacterium]